MRQGFHGHVGAKVVTLRAELLYFRGVKAEWVRGARRSLKRLRAKEPRVKILEVECHTTPYTYTVPTKISFPWRHNYFLATRP